MNRRGEDIKSPQKYLETNKSENKLITNGSNPKIIPNLNEVRLKSAQSVNQNIGNSVASSQYNDLLNTNNTLQTSKTSFY